jgi:hypothetical protein
MDLPPELLRHAQALNALHAKGVAVYRERLAKWAQPSLHIRRMRRRFPTTTTAEFPLVVSRLQAAENEARTASAGAWATALYAG